MNGESIAVFYNPSCGNDQSTDHYAYDKMCVNFIYDLNGKKAPNQVGKDIGFITTFYKSSPSVVGPFPYEEDLEDKYPSYSEDGTDAATACKNVDTNLRLPDRDEAASLFINMGLMGITKGDYLTGSVLSAGSDGNVWRQDFDHGARLITTRSDAYWFLCIYK